MLHGRSQTGDIQSGNDRIRQDLSFLDFGPSIIYNGMQAGAGNSAPPHHSMFLPDGESGRVPRPPLVRERGQQATLGSAFGMTSVCLWQAAGTDKICFCFHSRWGDHVEPFLIITSSASLCIKVL